MRGERRLEGISERLHSLAEIVFVAPPALAVSGFYLYTVKRHCWKSPFLVNKMACLRARSITFFGQVDSTRWAQPGRYF